MYILNKDFEHVLFTYIWDIENLKFQFLILWVFLPLFILIAFEYN